MIQNGRLQLLRNRWWSVDGMRCPDVMAQQQAWTVSERGVTKGIDNMSKSSFLLCVRHKMFLSFPGHDLRLIVLVDCTGSYQVLFMHVIFILVLHLHLEVVPFIFLAAALLAAILVALVELIFDIWTTKGIQKKGAVLVQRIKEALCCCLKKKPPPPVELPESKYTQTVTY